jgi:site-specific recombinase XerD
LYESAKWITKSAVWGLVPAQLEYGAYSHLFRHTFATELLTAGRSLETVGALLGHGSTKIAEKYYAHWVKGRQ